MTQRTAARILVDQLVAQGVDRATCVPGESYLQVLDALIGSGIDLLTCRAEGGAAMMAEAYGKLTGRPGICFVTRGPGATNASPGLHIAMQDSTPMILFVGQIERGMRDREAFQELDYRATFGALAKWVVEIDDADRIPEIVARAFRVAMQGRPGPVVIALPEDMLDDTADVADAPRVEPVDAVPAQADIDTLGELLAGASNPVAIVGGSRWTPDARDAMVAFAHAQALPVAAQFRRAPLFPATDDHFIGDLGLAPNPRLIERIKAADLIVLIGGRMSEIASQSYTLLGIPNPGQKLVHVHPDPMELGRVYQPTLAINATPGAFLEAASRLAARAGDVATARADYLSWSNTPPAVPGDFQYGDVMTWLRDRLPPDAVICNGAGNFASWIHRYYRFRDFGTQLAPTSGSMGYGLPAGVMAKRQKPDSIVLTLAGDGDFLMNGQEFATAVHHDIPLIVAVIDNGIYGTIRMHQERTFPGRISATKLTNPDFAALARAYGGHGETVSTTAEFAPAFERAVASGKPAILHCLLDPQAITPTATLDGIRAAAEKR
ncbi:thiamine pyrophosphate-binding protein [Sphingomonas panacisoli]|uniref:Thiamine pyrophosphate-binding protein n=1 Tax=Sphingomonas panacisoli TaxID=1813879 RepID=A0A5B8LFT3_9SPHN|nr:thiamine pyrophosphate-binding protein [Sphingomonas panacisoli]QDZ06574.1 thiamine pyrophosphate-binding protein [Sphingomonas panacisoli]